MRRGQLLSFDAMLSLIIVILMLGMITSTSSALKDDITIMLGWYERANIGDNMLDIIVKNPGVPSDWESDPSNLVYLGLESSRYPNTIDYLKIEALNKAVNDNDPTIRSALANLSMGKDFTLGFYLTRVEIIGNVSVVPPNIEGSVEIPQGGHLSVTPRTGYAYGKGLYAEWINPERIDYYGAGNIDYIINISAGESFSFKVAEGANVRVDLIGPNNLGGPVNYQISPGSVVHIDVDTGYVLIGWNYLGNGIYELWIPYHRNREQIWTTWTGTIWWGQKGEVSSTNLTIRYVYATKVVDADYNMTMINGTFVEDSSIIRASMDRSPWITYTERRVPMTKMIYNRSYTVTPNDLPKELYVGSIYTSIPDYMALKVGFNDTGYIVMVAWMRGTNISGYSVLAAYKASVDSNIQLIINQTINGKTYVKSYTSGSPDYVIVQWKEFLTQIKQGESLDIHVWVYEMRDIDQVEITDLNGIKTIMKPQASLAVLKLWVWDDS
ncbi:hypothetical protein E3E35_00285 [Thermococcus sp. GR7]|uniref:hypothetical protein n=1 Tax=unclassified Thermococcus TaxID=2627626 RepID=UPI00142FBDA8|nr:MULTISPECIES: hypothetical protein [unclassified Thermococcus]NJE45869.1 hypothetical protein [Thermococcus sp. GR7]NJE78759.1 hypothetical protein [Thermococcus sp. GR4]NJF22063.1 hypothetical protein [Thermococcus sp. GR5]